MIGPKCGQSKDQARNTTHGDSPALRDIGISRQMPPYHVASPQPEDEEERSNNHAVAAMIKAVFAVTSKV